jgi:hypothetical protein
MLTTMKCALPASRLLPIRPTTGLAQSYDGVSVDMAAEPPTRQPPHPAEHAP